MQSTRKQRRRQQSRSSSRKKSFNKKSQQCPTFPKVFNTIKNIKPGKDFYNHVNGRWINSVNLKNTETARSVSSEIQSKINTELVKLIGKCLRKPNTPDKRMIAQFVSSLIKKQSKELAKKTVQVLLNQIDCITSTDQITSLLGRTAYKGMCNLITVSSGPEEENAQHLRIRISMARTGLPDKDYYNPKTEHNHRIYDYYKYMLNKIGNIFHLDNMDNFAEMERKYINIIDQAEDEKTVVRTGAELEDAYKHINWTVFWEQFDIKPQAWRRQRFVIYSQKWLKYVNNMFTNMQLDEWKIYLRGMIIMCYLQFLTDDITKYEFQLYNHLLNGQRKPVSRLAYILKMAKTYLEIPLSRIYVEETHNAEFRDKIKHFIKSIQTAAIERIHKTDWLAPKTREAAAKKVENINLGVLYMTQSYNYKVPQLTNNIINNIQLIGKSLIEKELDDVENKYTTDLWDDVPVFNVNAYYSSAGNRLFIPSAIVNWPFYCEHSSTGWNYGALGCVIGHEIIHAFDDYGKDFNELGNRADWWTAADKRHYNEKTDTIIALYKQSKLYGQHVDAEDTLGENIADLGGLAVSLHALKTELNARKPAISDEERLKEYRAFFTAYAVSWREKERRAHGLRELTVDVHSPAIIRVNNVVCHFQEWYDVFDVCTSDPMYIPVNKRIRIF